MILQIITSCNQTHTLSRMGGGALASSAQPVWPGRQTTPCLACSRCTHFLLQGRTHASTRCASASRPRSSRLLGVSGSASEPRVGHDGVGYDRVGAGSHPRQHAVRLGLMPALEQAVGRVRQRQRAQEQQQRRRCRARQAQPPAPAPSPMSSKAWYGLISTTS